MEADNQGKMTEKYIILNKGRESSVERKHPWIFSGAVKHFSEGLKDGEIMEVRDHSGSVIAKAHYQGGASIVGRILAFENIEIDQQFWIDKFVKALHFRKNILGLPNEVTNAYRLIHGEGDELPGLIIDIYDRVAVVQCHSSGMHKSKLEIVAALKSLSELNLKTIYNKSKETLPDSQNSTSSEGLLYGEEVSDLYIKENQHAFMVQYNIGQKTGFFLDQRENRAFVGSLSKDRSVLNCFCYTGGFSVYALSGGASKVESVDISAKAMELCDLNVSLASHTEKHVSHTANVMEYLKNEGESFDIVIVDPPAFAKSINKRHNAVQAYKRLNALAMQKVKKGGLLFTFSCSQVISNQLFYDTIVAAGMEAGRNAKVVKHMSQGGDHPVNLFHPEGHYLKGLMVYVD